MKNKNSRTKTRKKWFTAREAGVFDPNAVETPAKVRITTYLDSDVLNQLKSKANRLGIPYQTLLNSELRQAMSSAAKIPSTDDIRRIVREELEKAS